MSRVGTYEALNRLLTTLYRSLPMYLTYASPWTHRSDKQAVETIERIVEDQRQLSTRVAQHIMDNYGPLELGEYPLDFPDTHDLAFDYLLGKLVACQKVDVANIEACAPQLRDDRQAAALAEEALGGARGHLETLEELAAQVVKDGVTWGKQ